MNALNLKVYGSPKLKCHLFPKFENKFKKKGKQTAVVKKRLEFFWFCKKSNFSHQNYRIKLYVIVLKLFINHEHDCWWPWRSKSKYFMVRFTGVLGVVWIRYTNLSFGTFINSIC